MATSSIGKPVVLMKETSRRMAEVVRRNYLMFHTMDPAMAVENLKGLAAQRA